MLELTICALVLTNLACLYWIFMSRRSPVKLDPEILAFYRAIKKFEADRGIVLNVQTVNPDDVFLRNLGR